MRYLQYATIDLAKGLGGVEVHARSITRELAMLGVEAALSRDPEDLKTNWDVIHTHGSAIPFFGISPQSLEPPIRIHTLHGTTLGRMAACGEWLWPGGYLAAFRELVGVLQADIVAAVHGNLWLFKLARRLGKHCIVCSNGWDPAEAPAPLPAELDSSLKRLKPFWVYIGRGGDPVKAVERVHQLVLQNEDLHLVVAPGEGFEKSDRVHLTGVLSSAQVQSLLDQAVGLILTSKYEGLPLVVLEALGKGLLVVSTPAGGMRALPSSLQGLFLSNDHSPHSIERSFKAATQLNESAEHRQDSRLKRAAHNRTELLSWRDVANRLLTAVRTTN